MKIVHVTETHEASAGGIPTVVDQLARQMSGAGVQVDIISIGRDPMPPPATVRLANVPPRGIGKLWGWSPHLRETIEVFALGDMDRLFHIHGAWLASQWCAATVARRWRLPCILSLHGQLEPYHWKDRGHFHFVKKKLYWRVIAQPAFRSVRVIHAVTPEEKRNLAGLFDSQSIVVIPNAVDLDHIDRALDPASGLARRPVVGFVGRFHPKKGADILIEAFGLADLRQEWQLLLAGPPGRQAYMVRLAELVASSPARDRIRFVGPLVGEAKWQFYRTASVVAVPSLSEVIGMVNLEAAACGTPTITTHETGVEDWEAGGGMLVRPAVGELAEALSRMCSLGNVEYERRSGASRRLVEHRYSWKVVRQLWVNLYHSVL